MTYDLAIIVVAYNQPDVLRVTLQSIAQHTHDVTYQTFVFDNASTDVGVMALLHEFPAVRFVRSNDNLGFAGANNRGIAVSAARYVVLLNPDTLLTDDALSALVRWLDDHPTAGAVGPRLVQPDGHDQPYSYGAAPSPKYMARRMLARQRGTYLHAWHGSTAQCVDWVAGTCMVVRRAAIDVVGPLDEQFFLYFEDVDWGMRLHAAGWPVYWLPSVAVMHVGGGSVGAFASAHYDRSLVRLYGKYYGGLAAACVWWLLRAYRVAQRRRS